MIVCGWDSGHTEKLLKEDGFLVAVKVWGPLGVPAQELPSPSLVGSAPSGEPGGLSTVRADGQCRSEPSWGQTGSLLPDPGYPLGKVVCRSAWAPKGPQAGVCSQVYFLTSLGPDV